MFVDVSDRLCTECWPNSLILRELLCHADRHLLRLHLLLLLNDLLHLLNLLLSLLLLLLDDLHGGVIE